VVPLAAAISDQHLNGATRAASTAERHTSRVKTQIASFRQSPDDAEGTNSLLADRRRGLKNQCVDAHMHARLLSGSRFFPYRCAHDDFH
jgi:hypothetical protein